MNRKVPWISGIWYSSKNSCLRSNYMVILICNVWVDNDWFTLKACDQLQMYQKIIGAQYEEMGLDVLIF